MKKLFAIIAVVLLTASVFAQSPQKMSYQAVIRNSSDQLVTTQEVGMQISILQSSSEGTPVYVETQTPTTNANGLVSIEIGAGTLVTGTFAGIDWSTGSYFIKTETDPSGGTSYSITGTSQLLSVPYALHAKTSESITGTVTETDPVFVAHPANGITGANITNWITAYGWGNHSGLYRPLSYVPAWSEITSKPTTIVGYGITDAFNGTWASLTGKPTGNNTGDLQYWNGSAWVIISAGTSGQILTINDNIPSWQNGSAFSNPIAPTSTALAATNVLMNTATLNGSVNANGFSATVSFEYGLTTSYGSTTTATQSPVTGNTNTSVSKSVSSLLANTTYHFRLKTSNAVGVTYSSDMSLTTSGAAPTASTTASSGTTTTGATLNGTVNANGFSSTVTFEYGLTTAYGQSATATQSPVTGNSSTNVSASITGLSIGTTYHYRLTATNSLGTTNGNDMTFTTLGLVPTASTVAATSITVDGSTLNGTVNANYLSTTVSFEYGLTTSYGSPATATPSTVTGNSSTNVSASITGLAGGTTYHYRVIATNSLGTTNGDDMTFTTLGAVPTASTTAITNISTTGATISGTVNANYLSTTVSFEYGLTTGYGQTATATQSPVTGSTSTNVSANITGLTIGTTYHYRVNATNSLGTTNGNDMTFTTAPTSISDVDGNTYNVVAIGTQVWMAENLKTTKYNDNSDIPLVADQTAWSNIYYSGLETPAYCWYDNDIANKSIYGALYNWYTINGSTNGNKNACPTGWHVPSNTEWATLPDYLTNNGYGYEGSGDDIAKAMASTSGWTTYELLGTVGNDQASNNSSGFTALPSGYRGYSGGFSEIGDHGNWWSSTELSTANALHRYMDYYRRFVNGSNTIKANGVAVRCLRD